MNYIDREEWGSIYGPAGYTIPGPVAEVYVHHFDSGILAPHELADSLSRVRGAQRWHVEHNEWGDIGYSWLVDDEGRIFEGRGWWRTGAHTAGYNSKGYGICWIGDSYVSLPTEAALRAIVTVIFEGISIGAIDGCPTIVAHRDRNPDTDCCGSPMYTTLPALRQMVLDGYGPNPTPVPPPRRKAQKMSHIIRINAPGTPYNGVLYVTDGVTKVPIQTMEVANEMVESGVVERALDGATWTNVSLAFAQTPMSGDEWMLAGMAGRITTLVKDAVQGLLIPLYPSPPPSPSPNAAAVSTK